MSPTIENQICKPIPRTCHYSPCGVLDLETSVSYGVDFKMSNMVSAAIITLICIGPQESKLFQVLQRTTGCLILHF